MKKFFSLFVICMIGFVLAPKGFAEEYKVLVLPDSLQFESTNYYVFPDASVIFATDTINNFNKNGKIVPVSMSEVRDTFRSNPILKTLAKNTLKEFKYNYNIGFVDLKRLTHKFGTNKILIISSTTDIQNYFMRRTIWDQLNIAGATVINPSYKVSTYVALVDVDKEQILWQQTFQKMLTQVENRIVAVNFAPAAEQLEQIKNYSNILSSLIATKVEGKIIPPPVMSVEGDVVSPEVINVPKIDVPVSSIQSKLENEIKTKPYIPTRQRLRTNGSMINDL